MTGDAQTPGAALVAEPPMLPRVSFTEGSIALPAGYEDRTQNVLLPPNTQTQANLSVARDWMKPEETLDAYVERQLALLKSQLAGHRVIGREAVVLGGQREAGGAVSGDAGAGLLRGLRIDAHYKNGKLTVYQRQAAFEVAPRRVLIFTASRAHGFGEAFERQWTDWLASYAPPPATAPSEAAGPAPGENPA